MMRHFSLWLGLLACAAVWTQGAFADDEPTLADPLPAAEESSDSDEAKKYTLKYQFQPGEALRWKVEHRASIRTTVSGTTQTVETLSTSVKVWRATEQDDDGNLTFELRSKASRCGKSSPAARR